MNRGKTRTLRSMIILLYVFMTILNITLLTLIISDNQAEIMTENATYKAREMLISVARKMKEFSTGLTLSKTTNMIAEKDQFDAMDKVLAPVIRDYLITDDTGNIIFQPVKQMHIPALFAENIRKALVNQEYSSAEYFLVTDEKSEFIHFYYPMDALGFKNRVLYAAYDLKNVRAKYEKLFNSIKIVVVLVIFFHLFMAFYINRLVVGPIFRLRDVTREIASGKYDTRIHLKRNDELGELAEGFNFMAGQIKIIEEQKAEQARSAETRKFLDNINEGLLLIDPSLKVGSQYSRYMKQIFVNREIAGQNLVELVYPNAETQILDRKDLEGFLNLLFTNTTSAIEMLNELNPVKDKLINIPDPEGKKEDRIVKITLQRIENAGVIENMMVLFEDKTSIYQKEQELELERLKKSRDAENMAAILKLGHEIFYDFIEKTRQIMDKKLDKLPYNDRETNLAVFARELRDLKYLASLLELGHMVDCIKTCEDQINLVRHSSEEDFPRLMARLPAQFLNVLTGLNSISSNLERVKEFEKTVKGAGFNKTRVLLDNFVRSLQDMTASVSREQGKEIQFNPVIQVDQFPWLLTLRNPLMLLVRNSIEHGIEDSFERLSLFKNQKGQITFKMMRDEKSYFITVEDDGRGIDFDHIRNKAFEKGLLKENNPAIPHPDLFKLAMTHAYSARNPGAALSETGGELWVVMDEVKKLHGTFHVISKSGKGTVLQLIIPSEQPK